MSVRLFCLPFAGGSVYSYRELGKHLPGSLEFVALEPPGRGRRFSEPLMTDMHAMAEDTFSRVREGLSFPYAFYGHSLGAYVAYLTVKRIVQHGLPLPLHLFVSGRAGPSHDEHRKNLSRLPGEEFRALLEGLEGCPRELLANGSMMRFFEPIIRADFRAHDAYVYEETAPFDVPITVMIGSQDVTTPEGARKWQQETIQGVEVIEFPGSHFFIFDHFQAMAQIISQTIARSINPARSTG